jgi:hypothetical protein
MRAIIRISSENVAIKVMAYPVTQKVSINFILITLHFIIAGSPGALLIPVNNDLELGGGVSVTMLTSDFGVEGIFVVGHFFEHNTFFEMGVRERQDKASVADTLSSQLTTHNNTNRYKPTTHVQ